MGEFDLDRRTLLVAGGAWLMLGGCGRGDPPPAVDVAEPPLDLLERSEFVYVSPLRRDRSESRCKGEVWFGWLDRAVVMCVNAQGWKARSIRAGRDRARIWVGDHGKWRHRLLGLELTRDAYRRAPSFLARGEITTDDALFARLMEIYERKYFPDNPEYRENFPRWHGDGTDVMIRYRPV